MTGFVVVGVDGSEQASHAAMWAAEEAAGRRFRLDLVHVRQPMVHAHTPLEPPMTMLTEDALQDSAETVLKAAARRCRTAQPDVEVHSRVELGTPAEVLASAGKNAALVVVGRTGSGRVAQLLLGSTAADLMRQCDAPVVAVPETEAPDSKVVVGVDGSATSTRAVGFAYEFAARRGAELVIVHAGSDMTANADQQTWIAEVDAELKHDVVTESVADWPDRYPHVRARTVLTAKGPAEALVEQAQGAALVVVGSHGRGPVRRALLGSVSHEVVQAAPCPVAVLRSV